jgi:hypothetical protein
MRESNSARVQIKQPNPYQAHCVCSLHICVACRIMRVSTLGRGDAPTASLLYPKLVYLTPIDTQLPTPHSFTCPALPFGPLSHCGAVLSLVLVEPCPHNLGCTKPRPHRALPTPSLAHAEPCPRRACPFYHPCQASTLHLEEQHTNWNPLVIT